ncbi:MAG: hypothetical protein HY890_05650 [Deltaproteobacteria bacterium]|nr:hypothetical protein [Deltaproteobacteria bacterium]
MAEREIAEREVEVVARLLHSASASLARFQENVETAASKTKNAFDGLNVAQNKTAEEVEKSIKTYTDLKTGLDNLQKAVGNAVVAAQENTLKTGLLGQVMAKAGEIAQFHYKPSAVEEIYGAYYEYGTALLSLKEFNKQVAKEMEAAGMEKDERERANAELSMRYAAKERDFKLQTLSQSFDAAMDFMENLYVATGSSSKRLFHAMKAFAIAQALVDTLGGANRALNSLPFPANIAAAATVLASGMARVVQIMASERGGGSMSEGAGTAYHGVSSSSYPVSPVSVKGETKQTQNITIQIYNPLSEQNWAKIVEDNIVPALNDAANRNVNLVVRYA